MNEKQEEEAIFWCGLLQRVLYGDIPRGRVAAFLRELSTRKVTFPDGKKRRPSVSTLKRKLKQYRKDRVRGLYRKSREDRGTCRAASKTMVERAIALKKDQPKRSPQIINQFLKREFGRTMARSTMLRHLRGAGATRRKLGVVKEPVRKRWTVSRSNEMWIGDFSHGPYVLEKGQSLRTKFSVFLDVHSRYPVSARYYWRENTDVLCESFLHAIGLHGAPEAVYVDNAKVYHGDAINRLCFHGGIKLLHRRAYDPAGGGLVERYIQTVQQQFETEVRGGSMLTLQDLNRSFSAWNEVVYLKTCHGDGMKPPKAMYEEGRSGRRHVDIALIEECFWKWEKRTVDRVFSDIRLKNRFFRVDQKLRGDRVWVAYDFRIDPESVRLYSLEKVFLGKAVAHQREEGEAPQVPSQGGIQNDLLGLLREEQRRERRADPVNFQNALTRKRWPLEAFLQALAQHLGKSGGVSGFSTPELEALQTVHRALPGLTRSRLRAACEGAPFNTLPSIVFELQKEDS